MLHLSLGRLASWLFVALLGLGGPVVAGDLVFATDQNGNIYLSEWDADADFLTTPAIIDSNLYSNSRGIGAADFNNNGLIDAITAGFSNNLAYIIVHLNNGDGTFTKLQTQPPISNVSDGSAWAHDFATGDFNHDGHMDAAVSWGSTHATVLLGNGDGTFRVGQLLFLGGNGRGMDVADFNRDGHLDLLRARFSDGFLYMMPGNGDGTFGSPVFLADVGSDPYGVCAGDFNGDGFADIIANSGGDGTCTFLAGNGDGTFAAPVILPALKINTHGSFASHDFNGNGRLDMVISSHASPGRLYFCENTGNDEHGNPLFVVRDAGLLGTNSLAVAVFSDAWPIGTPEPDLSPTVQTVDLATAASFDSSASVDDGTFVSFSWDPGDGSSPLTSAILPALFTHTYTTAGVYYPRLTVTDNDGTSRLASAKVIARGTPPVVADTAVVHDASAAVDGRWPLLLDVRNFVSDDAGVAEYTWRFNDGYANDFESASLDGWLAMDGTWTIDASAPISGARSLYQSDATRDRTVHYFNRFYKHISQDVRVETDFKFISGSQEIHLLLGGLDYFRNYQIIVRGGSNNDVLLRTYWHNSFRTILAAKLPAPLAVDTVYTLRVECRGLLFEVYLDNVLIGTMATTDYPVGRVGLSTYRTAAMFDNFSISTSFSARSDPQAFRLYDFEDATMADFTATSGSWTVSTTNALSGNFSLQQTGTSVSRARIVNDTVQQADYAVSATVRSPAGTGEEIFLILDYQDANNYYEVSFRGRNIEDTHVYRIVNGASSSVGRVFHAKPIDRNITYEIMVARRGGFFDIYLDGQLSGSCYDSFFQGGATGIATYNSHWLIDDLSIGPPPALHSFAAGTTEAELTVRDAAGQSASGLISFTMQSGTIPVAHAGAPQQLDESTGVLATGFAVTLDASATTDADFSADDLLYSWHLGTDTFAGTARDEGKWIISPEGVSWNDGITITGLNSWGRTYLCSTHGNTRANGLVLEARLKATGNTMIGFKNNTATVHYNQQEYSLYFNSGTLMIYEYSSSRGTYATYTPGAWYDIRIEVKASGGARYYYRPDGVAEWLLLYDSNFGTTSPLRRSIDVYSGTTVLASMSDVVGGKQPTSRVYGIGEHLVTLTVTDPAGNSNTDTVTITTSANNPPSANAGNDITRNEADAIDRVWTVNFNGAGSTDDFGIWKYEWDFAYDGNSFNPMASGITASYAWTDEGVYTIALRVTDHAGQTDQDTLILTINDGAPPVANPGGPYVLTEISAPAYQGAWPVTVDGSASSDADSSIVEYRWDLGSHGFDGTTIDTAAWMHGPDTTQNNQITIANPGTTNGTHYLVSTDTYSRVRGMAMEWRQMVAAGAHTYGGFRHTDSNYALNRWVYAIRFSGNKVYTSIYGSQVDTGFDYVVGTWYDLRIELKPTSGARFYYRATGESEWILISDHTGHTDTTFRRGFLAYTGTVTIDDVRDLAAGVSPTVRLYPPAGSRQISLTVVDQGLNSHTATTTVTLSPNAPPVANVGPDRTADESTAVQNTWTFTFSAAASSDDNGIWGYEWDWDYDAGAGFRPSGDIGRTASHTFTGEGIRTVALRVRDHLQQTDIDTATVTLTSGEPPTAVTGPAIITELGWHTLFVGTESFDDYAVSRYIWDFGDGTIGEGPAVRHAYTSHGDFTVSLTVADGAGQLSTPAMQSVTVITSTPPIADAGGPYTAGAGGPPVYLNGSGSRDDGAAGVQQGIVKYLWDMDLATDSDGDGDPTNDIDVTGMSPAYIYNSAGTYQIRLTVVDGAGQMASATSTVVVSSSFLHEVVCVPWHGDPNAPHTSISGTAIKLKGIMRGTAGTFRYQWDFGDGSAPWPATPATVSNRRAIEATHTYSGPPGKLFIAVLTVWDEQDNAVSDPYYVRLAPDTLTARADIAIDEGLWYLHKAQQSDGRWSANHGGYVAGGTASALQAFEINGHRLRGNWREDPYAETVSRGFDYLCTRLINVNITTQASGDPDSNGNGIGVSVSGSRPIYELGQVMDAIASSQSPLFVPRMGVAAGRTFHEILTDMVDMYAWGQVNSGSSRGGWRYSWNSGSDNSAAQWGAIGMLAAWQNFGINVPQFVHTENDVWLNYSSNGTYFGYSAPNSYHQNPIGTTASGLVQLAFNGVHHTSDRWRASEDALAAEWPFGGANSTNYYSLYSFAKAMRTAHPNPIPLLRRNGIDWYNDPDTGLRAKLVREQHANKYWSKTYDLSGGLGIDITTAWSIIMLTPTLFVQPPVAIITAPGVWGYGEPLPLDASRSYHTDALRNIVQYEWDFDGNGSWDYTTANPLDPAAFMLVEDPDPLNAGDPPVEVTVRLRVTDDNLPPQSDTVEVRIIFAEPPHAPYARISGPTTVTEGVTVVYDGSGSFDIDPGDFITLYEWDLSNNGEVDWSGANLTQIEHVFNTVGIAGIALRVTDNGVLNNDIPLTSEWQYLLVEVKGNLPPVADPGGPYTTYAHESILLDGTASSDPNGDPITHAWDLDDDGIFEVTTATVSVMWTEAGVYTVTLQVSDSVLIDTRQTTVTVLPNHLLTVQSAPMSGVLISGSHTVTTPGSQRIHDETAVVLTAPVGSILNGADYLFSHWRVDDVDQPAGQRTLSFEMLAPHICVAVYTIVRHTLTVDSSPFSGIAITGTAAGTTGYTVQVDDHSEVMLTAPLLTTIGGYRWRLSNWEVDGTPQTAGQGTLTFTIEANTHVEVHYESVTYTVTFDLAGKGTRTGGGELVQQVAHGMAAIAPTFDTDAGWIFSGWDTAFANVTADLTVTATYEEVTVSFAVAAQEQDESAGAVDVVVTLSHTLAVDVSVPFTVTGTAMAGDDYTISASPLVIAAGQTQASIVVTIVDDLIEEADETVILSLGTPINAGLGAITQHTLYILDNDAVVPPPEPRWPVITGDASQPIWTIYLKAASVDEVPLTTDDELAIFDGEKLVGSYRLLAPLTGSVDPAVALKAWSALTDGPGFVAGHSYRLVCWVAAEQRLYDLASITFDTSDAGAYSGTTFPAGASPFSAVELQFSSVQSIPLRAGFQFISSNRTPSPADMATLFQPLIAAGHLSFVRNSDGASLQQAFGVWQNGIGDWTISNGYLVRLWTADTLELSGPLIDAQTPIPLREGFQFIAYLPEYELAATTVFDALKDAGLIFVRDSHGNTLQKSFGLWQDGIGAMSAGQGYLVRMSTAGTLIYPQPTTPVVASEPLLAAAELAPANGRHWPEVAGDASQAVWTLFLLSAEVGGNALQAGDEIAIFDGAKLVGSYQLAAGLSGSVNPSVSLKAWAALNDGAGYGVGNSYTIKLWHAATSQEATATVAFPLEDPGAYEGTTFPAGASPYSAVALTGVLEPGTLSVTLEPAGARTDGARWLVEGDATEYVSGAAAELAPGEVTVTFKAVTGWVAPAPFTTLIVSGETTTESATYTRQTYTVTFDLAGQGTRTGGGELVQTVTHGEAAIAPTVVGNVGLTFTGWDVAFANVTADLTVTAQYAVTTYTLTYSADANGSITGEATQTVEHGASGTQVTAVADDGYYFVEWSDGLETASRTDTNITANLSVTALFASPQSHNLIYNLSIRGNRYGGGSGSARNATGYLIFDVEGGQAVALVKWATGGDVIDFNGEGAMWYRCDVGVAPEYWFLTRTIAGPTIATAVDTYSYLHLFGREHPVVVNIGSGTPARLPASLSGVWRAGDDTGNAALVELATLEARIDINLTRAANGINKNYGELVPFLAERLGITMPETMPDVAVEEASVQVNTSAGLVCYRLNWSGLTAGEGEISRFAYGGFVILDISSGQSRTLVTWQDGQNKYYRLESSQYSNAFNYTVGVGRNSFLFLGDSSYIGDGQGFRHLYGQLKPVKIDGENAQNIALTLSGNLWGHQQGFHGEGGLFTQSAITWAAIVKTLDLNQRHLTLEEAVTDVIETFLGDYEEDYGFR